MDLSARDVKPAAVERRAMPFKGVELRAADDGTGGSTLTFTGYACVTEMSYEMEDWLGPYTEVVRAGAFKKTLNESADVPFLINHAGMTLARTKSGTLQLSEDSTGLLTEAQLDPANPQVQSLQSAMDRRDLDEMSFAFWVTRQQWSPDFEQRDILEVNLNKGDVSIVNYGANPHTAGAQLNARDLAGHLQRLGVDERREVFDRLAVEFVEREAQPAAVEKPAAPADLDLYRRRARLAAL
jgi:HK97 family phage prohead protease